jgi:hypothetical protein
MHKLILGVMALAAGMALITLSIATRTTDVLAGNNTPTATPDPTIDPCDQFKGQPPPTCIPTQPPRRESTNTPEATDTPAATNTSPPAGTTNTPQPPATNTPGGGAGGGGVSPPDTGSGPSAEGVSMSWMMVVGGLLAAAGAGTLVYGARRGR